MHPSRQRNPFSIHMAQIFLCVAEQTSGTRKGERHGPDLPKDLVPVFYNDLLMMGGGGWIGFS